MTRGNATESGWKLYLPNDGNVLRFLNRPNYLKHDYRFSGLRGWHMITVVIANGRITTYIDKNGVATKATPSGLSLNNSYPVEIGHAQGSPYYAKGKIDDVRVYNRALSPTEIQALYNE